MKKSSASLTLSGCWVLQKDNAANIQVVPKLFEVHEGQGWGMALSKHRIAILQPELYDGSSRPCWKPNNLDELEQFAMVEYAIIPQEKSAG